MSDPLPKHPLNGFRPLTSHVDDGKSPGHKTDVGGVKMKMHKLGRFIAAIVCFPSALLAQTDLDRMMQAFDNVPVTAIMKDDLGIAVSFHNTAASRDVDLGRFGANGAEDIFAFGLAAPNSIRDRLYLYLDED
ncbi:hypothetical protein [Halovulum sp. GXIMD14793]